GLLVVRPRAAGRAADGRPRLRESLRLVAREPRLAGFLVIVAVVGFASDPINTLAPAYAHVFGHPDTFAGYLIGAFGIGAVAGAFGVRAAGVALAAPALVVAAVLAAGRRRLAR